MPDGLFTTVAELAKAGFAGVGIIVFLLLFILLMRGKPIDPASAKLQNRFLTWGVSFAVFCGVLSIVSLFAQPAAAPLPEPPRKLTMTFAPDFTTEKLPAPRIKLSDGKVVQPDQEFIWPGGMINVSVGDAFNEIKMLKATVGQYGEAIGTLREQRDALAAALPASAAAPEVSESLKTSSEASVTLQKEIKTAIDVGDFTRAARASTRLNAPAVSAAPAIRNLTRRER